MIQYFSYEDFKKTRRSILFFSIATFLFAGVNIIDDEISILGLSVQVSHLRIVSTGQIASIVLLAIYFLQVMPEVIKLIKDFLLTRHKKIETYERTQLEHGWGLHDGKDYENGPAGEFEALGDKHDWLRKKIEGKFDLGINIASYIAVGFVDFAFPAIIGAMCALDPYILDRHLSQDEQAVGCAFIAHQRASWHPTAPTIPPN